MNLIEPRLYRAAFIPALVALGVLMFSFERAPRPAPQVLAGDVLFDGRLALREARRLADAHPDRRPGTAGDAALARRVEATFEQRGLDTRTDAFEAEGRRLVNVIGRRTGVSRREVVVLAARDGRPGDRTAGVADTAALLELSRVLEGRVTRRTIVLASVDGSTLGSAGTRRLVDAAADRDRVDAVLVISHAGVETEEGPSLVAWSNDASRGSLGLWATAAESLRREQDAAPAEPSTLTELARLAAPVGIGEQGPLLAEGVEAIRFSGSGELPPSDGDAATLDAQRLGELGRGVLRTVTALDRGPSPEHGPRSYVTAVSQVLPVWVLSLLAGTLLLPALVGALDALARARRQRVEVFAWLRWVGAWVAPFLAGLAVAELLALAGATPAPPPAPVPPDVLPLDGPALGVLAGVGAGMALALLLARFLAARPDPRLARPQAPGAAVALALVATAAALVLWLADPYAGLLAVPAAHLWLLVLVAGVRPKRRVRGLLLALGALPALLVALYYLVALSMDPLSGAWYLLLLVTGHAVGLLTALVACVMLGALCASIELVYHSPAEDAEASETAGSPALGPGFALRR